ncbi:response regulator transcription factor [Leucothrix pacifica]|uniref:DNA-binding response regulator n=1 Tax=Leucothrix pacifica TaxID=1247513 RepID=A0A317CSD6_9GAMM|nr:response regulator transcription factor [Leucothrix pacifica]PWR00454.1 DNA-binding response regulator [Leucothrix pacifica]
MTQHNILLADDDIVLAEMLTEYLQGEGFDVTLVHNGEDALEASKSPKDMIILDIMMPKMDGLEVLKAVRQTDTDTPVIMLTARGDDIDRILGLELGADDYMPKPCNPRELLARVKAILRRASTSGKASSSQSDLLNVGDLEMNVHNRQAKLQDEVLILTQTEFDILQLLMQSADELITKQKISEDILGRKLGAYDRSIDVHISNLRRKLSQSTMLNIQTVRGSGYLLNVKRDAA